MVVLPFCWISRVNPLINDRSINLILQFLTYTIKLKEKHSFLNKFSLVYIFAKTLNVKYFVFQIKKPLLPYVCFGGSVFKKLERAELINIAKNLMC